MAKYKIAVEERKKKKEGDDCRNVKFSPNVLSPPNLPVI